MNRFNSANEEFNKLKQELVNDLKTIQTEYVNSQKKLEMAKQIVQKAKVEYKTLDDEYTKLVDYKNKCEEFIKYLQNENNKLLQKLNNLYEKQQNYNKYGYIENNVQLKQKKRLEKEEEEESEEEQKEEEEVVEDEEQHQEEEEEDITEPQQPLINKKKVNRPPPNKKRKIKKGISNFI